VPRFEYAALNENGPAHHDRRARPAEMAVLTQGNLAMNQSAVLFEGRLSA
jgi:hypothetical protein